jgi:RimJ/RimL family protein N-acetyltransferase
MMGYRLMVITISGFVEEGRKRKAIYTDGGWSDDVRMGILEEEYWAERSN